jgi:hypothetical protein
MSYNHDMYGHVGHIAVQGSYLFISAGYFAERDVDGGLRVVDISDEANPHVVATVNIPEAGFLHWHLA